MTLEKLVTLFVLQIPFSEKQPMITPSTLWGCSDKMEILGVTCSGKRSVLPAVVIYGHHRLLRHEWRLQWAPALSAFPKTRDVEQSVSFQRGYLGRIFVFTLKRFTFMCWHPLPADTPCVRRMTGRPSISHLAGNLPMQAWLQPPYPEPDK